MDKAIAPADLNSQMLRFTAAPLNGLLLIRRPIANVPAEGTMAFVDDGTRTGWHRRPTIALFKNGVWARQGGKPLPFAPTYWTVVDPNDGR